MHAVVVLSATMNAENKLPETRLANKDREAIVYTRVKICGLTRVTDALAACDSGVDSIGLVFYPPSSRNVSIEQAAEIIASVPPFVTITGLFLNAEKNRIDEILKELPLSMLQFHGTESADFCRSFERPYIKSVAMSTESDIHAYTEQFVESRGFLLDSNIAGGAGGSGELFDWDLVPSDLSAPVVLAGGLNGDNVAEAVAGVRPAAVDVSTGVESSKGIKDHAKMREFIQNVRAADRVISQTASG